MFTFANPWLLWAFPALLLPWIFRRRRQDQIQYVSFPLIEFLRESEEKDFINPQLQEWLLLILRTLLIALVLLALAGPRWNANPGIASTLFSFLPYAGSLQQQTIMIDTSYSMGARDGETTRWDKAALAYQEMRSRSSDVLSQTGVLHPGSASRDSAAPVRFVSQDDAAALFEQPPTSDGLSIEDWLNDSTLRAQENSRIVLLTDNQRWPWESLLQNTSASQTLPPLVVVNVEEEEASNAWVSVNTHSAFPWGIAGWETLSGSVSAYGRIDPNETSLALYKPESGEQVLQQSLSLPYNEGTITQVPFSLTRQTQEWIGALGNELRSSFELALEIDANDSLPFDDRLSTTIPVVDQFRIGIYGDVASGNDSTQVLQTSFRLWKGEGGNTALLTDMLPSGSAIPGETRLVLAAKSITPWWSAQDSSTLLEFVRQGGSALLFTGGESTPEWAALETELGWQEMDPSPEVSMETIRISGAGPLADALSAWDSAAWETWIPERHRTSTSSDSQSWVSYAAGEETATLISQQPYGLGTVWLVASELSVAQGTMLSPLFPVLMWELGKETVRDGSDFAAQRAPNRMESNLQPLSEAEKQQLADAYGITFTSIEEFSSGAAGTSDQLDFRLWLLALCVIVALTESWLANRLASM